ncbi:MAG: DUF4129 domain-containing protein [Chloroflexota bacterium]|nr:DUF4129 domain-containing protein [Chloroflexota bacterium]
MTFSLPIPMLSWRAELLRVAYAGMEISWFTPIFLIFVEPARQYPPFLVAFLLGALMLGFHFWTEAADHFQIDLTVERLLMLLALPVFVLLGWRIFLYPDLPSGDFIWIKESGFQLIQGGNSTSYWAILGTVLFLWWRGLALSRREYTFETVSFSFRLGLLLLIGGTLLLSYQVEFQVMAFVFPFFFFSLISVALARQEEVGQLKGDVGQIFDLYWLALLAGTVFLILAIGAIFLLVARPEGIQTVRDLWAPVGEGLLRLIARFLFIILSPLEPLLEWLAAFFARGIEVMMDQGFGETLQSFQILDEAAQEPGATPYVQIAFDIVRYICGGAILIGLVGMGLWLLGKERKRRREHAETHENLDANLGDALAGLLRNAGDRLRSAIGNVTRFGMSGDLLAAISVRNIYANMTRLSRGRGYPRRKAVTPYEYLADLEMAFPEAKSEARIITDAYVGVHYGEFPSSREELDDLRAAYKRLRASPSPDADVSPIAQ